MTIPKAFIRTVLVLFLVGSASLGLLVCLQVYLGSQIIPGMTRAQLEMLALPKGAQFCDAGTIYRFYGLPWLELWLKRMRHMDPRFIITSVAVKFKVDTGSPYDVIETAMPLSDKHGCVGKGDIG